MNTKQYVTDTHSLVWYFTENPRLSRKALKVFEKTVKEGTIIIPTVVLAEIMYIAEKGRITMSFAETVKKIEDSENFEITPLDLDILKKADEIDYELEMHDRLIVATALFFDAPLLTKDQTIKESNLCRVIW
ncbi:MAG: type II toxin-antitoxin system VapC family toxin [Candidatus Aminicenantes bacterium]|jgi:PIN domain nuclease of toxin-antitoxin system